MKKLVLILTFLLIFSGIALAQDATVEVTLEASPTAATEAPGDITVINNPETPTNETPTEPMPWLAVILQNISLALIAVGGVITAANKYLESKKTDVGFVTGGELVASRTPSFVKTAFKALIKSILAFGGNLQELFDEVTDDIPYVVKVHPAATTVDDGGDHVTRPQG